MGTDELAAIQSLTELLQTSLLVVVLLVVVLALWREYRATLNRYMAHLEAEVAIAQSPPFVAQAHEVSTRNKLVESDDTPDDLEETQEAETPDLRSVIGQQLARRGLTTS